MKLKLALLLAIMAGFFCIQASAANAHTCGGTADAPTHITFGGNYISDGFIVNCNYQMKAIDYSDEIWDATGGTHIKLGTWRYTTYQAGHYPYTFDTSWNWDFAALWGCGSTTYYHHTYFIVTFMDNTQTLQQVTPNSTGSTFGC